MNHKLLRTVALTLTLLSLVSLLAGCNSKTKPVVTEALQMNNAAFTIGVPSGATAVNAVESALPKAKMKFYNSLPDAYLAVQQGKVDAFAFDRYLLGFAIANGLEGVKVLPGDVGATDDVAIGISRKSDIPDLQQKINGCLAELNADGTLDDMFKRWVVNADDTMPDIPKPENPTVTLKVGTSGLVQPFSYYEGNELTGYDLELSARLALYLNADLEIKVYDYDGFPSAAEAGSIDCILANLNATPERRETMDFSTPLYQTQTALLVQGDGTAENVNETGIPQYTALNQLSGKVVACQTGSVGDVLINSVIPNVNYSYFNNRADMLTALTNGKVEAAPFDEPVAKLAVAQGQNLVILPEQIVEDHYGVALQKDSPLTKEVNDAIAQLKADGTLEEMKNKWTGADESVKILPQLDYPGANGTLRVVHDIACEPMEYIGADGNPVGYDLELMLHIGEILDRKVEFTGVDFSGLLPMIQSGKADAAVGCMSITDERKKTVDMSDSYYDGGYYFIVRKAGEASGSISTQTKVSLMDSLKASFTRTFLTENRWRLVLDGLIITVLISICSGLLGSLMGFGICMLRRSKKRIASLPAATFIRLIQGTPIVVLLMILYYIIFGKVDISAILVAIFGFAVNFGVYVSEMMRTGIDAVDKGQIEAAHALGFTKIKTFRKITFPQAARHFLPVFKGEFISMVKMTSVVGYIAIQDLTKVSDIIRSRTLEAFFPLIATAVIYFLVANILTMLLSHLESRLDPRRRKRTVKGVVMK